MRARALGRRLVPVVILSLVAASCAGADASEDTQTTTTDTAPPTTTTTSAPETTTTPPETMDHDMEEAGDVDHEALAAANLGTAAFQDEEQAEAAGYVSTMESLGCFENPGVGGMGLHHLREDLLDATLDPAEPEALVYELDHTGEIVELVAHEYLVPLEAWTDDAPPSLFGIEFHEHPVLPFWILHTWIWKENPAGTFSDWNPKVRMCPEGVPIFGVDLP